MIDRPIQYKFFVLSNLKTPFSYSYLCCSLMHIETLPYHRLMKRRRRKRPQNEPLLPLKNLLKTMGTLKINTLYLPNYTIFFKIFSSPSLRSTKSQEEEYLQRIFRIHSSLESATREGASKERSGGGVFEKG